MSTDFRLIADQEGAMDGLILLNNLLRGDELSNLAAAIEPPWPPA
jgi:hypothetical protein